MLERVNLSLINTYGCYNMSKFNENFSQRMILVFKIKNDYFFHFLKVHKDQKFISLLELQISI